MPKLPRVVFVTTQSLRGSTIVGRVLPLVDQLKSEYEIHILVLKSLSGIDEAPVGVKVHCVGWEPFKRTAQGKKRYSGLRLIFNMASTALRIPFCLARIKPRTVIMVKPLPASVLGVTLWPGKRKSRIILDVDDFELSANAISSLYQRAAINWSQRQAANLASCIWAATPFLVDHFEHLTKRDKPVILLPTGYTAETSLGDLPYNVHRDQPAILYIGSVSLASGHRVDLLPEILQGVMKYYSMVKMIIAGDGDDVAGIKELFARRGLEDAVQWIGRFTAEDIPQLLQESSLIIDPIDADIANRAKSSFRTSLAAATGWPVVTNNIGIRPYWLPDELHVRFFAATSDPESYVEKIKSLLEQPLLEVERESMKKRAGLYTWKVLSEQVKSWL